MSPVRWGALISFTSALAVAGCGGGDGGGSTTETTAGSSVAQAPAKTVTAPPRTAPATTPTLPAPAPTTTPTATTPTTTATSPENQPGGGGDEGGNRIPVALSVGAGGRVTPPLVQVPAFFRLAVSLHDRDGAPHTVVFTGAAGPARTFHIPAGGSAAFSVRSGKKTSYRVLVDGRPRGRVVTGASPGP